MLRYPVQFANSGHEMITVDRATAKPTPRSTAASTPACRLSAGHLSHLRRSDPPGAASSVQVADRWHLWHDLAEATAKDVAAHSVCWAKTGPPPNDGPRATTIRNAGSRSKTPATACPEMTALTSLVGSVVALLRPATANNDRLTDWISAARQETCHTYTPYPRTRPGPQRGRRRRHVVPSQWTPKVTANAFSTGS